MDEDEDTYGFGTFADLFDTAPAQAAKRLDLGALSHFCMPERLLSCFEQQQRRDQNIILYQHVAAKFDGARIDGGLGALGVSPLENGGVVWLQATQSDSDALERRKKELQDIANRQDKADHKSAAALFVAFTHVAAVQPTIVQNTVQGVEVKLKDGNRLELTFLPGPFAGPKHRDEFLETMKKHMSSGNKNTQETVDTTATHTPVDVTKDKEKYCQLIRRYTKLDPMSDDAFALAKQVHAGTGYYLRPMSKHTPKLSEDWEYRKKTMQKLSDALNQMNQENEDHLYEYTDTVTGAQISTRTYEQRYLEYVKAHDINPVIHMFPVQDKRVNREEVKVSHGSGSTISKENARSLFMKSLGVDISSSCIIDNDFFSLGADHTLSDTSIISRQSLVLPTSDDLLSTVAKGADATAADGGDLHESRTKRSRPTAQNSRRNARRASIVNTVEFPSTETSEAKDKAPVGKRMTPQASRKSPKSRQAANGYARKTSSLEMVGDDDSSLCKLCYSEEALVHMKPVMQYPVALLSCEMMGEQWRLLGYCIEGKKHNEAGREVKARLRDDERIEEEYVLSLARTLPVATAAGKLNVRFDNG
ncbi:hypothetical protein GN958_ATG14306 [Phytophthora infestans]|uniref:Uncharacterized protein n=1 Tax=Phytophthora infestans TaxID=4787 RepID=A0A8S9U7K5_PHYIN|nr:hypothetical protein GN958_ATG14306 [Phytophthora infestans]